MFSISPRRPPMLVMATTALGSAILRSARLFLIEQALCREFYEMADPALVQPDGSVEELRCKSNGIQADVALVSGLFEVITLISGLVATLACARFVSKFGKRNILFINICSLTLGACYSTAVCYFHGLFDIRLLWLTGFFDLLGGGLPVRNSLLYTIIAEVVEADVLSDTLYHLSAFVLAMSFLGTVAAAALLNVDVWLLSFLGIGVCALTIPLVFLLPPQSEANRETHALSSTAPQHSYESLLQDEEAHLIKKSTFVQMLRSMVMEATLSFQLLVDLLRDPLTRVTLLIYLINETAFFVRVTFPQWAAMRFNWTLADANAIASFSILVNGATLLLMPHFSKRLLRRALRSQQLVDSFVTKMSLCFNIIGIFFVGIAPLGVVYIISLGIYSLGAAMADSLRSFITNAVHDEESVRRLYIGISMVETVAALTGTTLWSYIFSAGIRKGGVALGNISFYAAAVLFCFALWLVHVLHRLVDKRQVVDLDMDEE